MSGKQVNRPKINPIITINDSQPGQQERNSRRQARTLPDRWHSIEYSSCILMIDDDTGCQTTAMSPDRPAIPYGTIRLGHRTSKKQGIHTPIENRTQLNVAHGTNLPSAFAFVRRLRPCVECSCSHLVQRLKGHASHRKVDGLGRQ